MDKIANVTLETKWNSSMCLTCLHIEIDISTTVRLPVVLIDALTRWISTSTQFFGLLGETRPWLRETGITV
jgi:hypothetical protein